VCFVFFVAQNFQILDNLARPDILIACTGEGPADVQVLQFQAGCKLLVCSPQAEPHYEAAFRTPNGRRVAISSFEVDAAPHSWPGTCSLICCL
jgi:hypothetical protein